jgi:hypothetical protein
MLKARLALGFFLLSAGMAWAALSELPPDEIERNRWLLSHLRKDREHYAQLLRNAQTLNDLPPAVRARIQLLDREVQAELSGVQARLLRAAQRYADWLLALSAEDRARVENEPDKDKRLAIIKEIRQRQYAEQLSPSQQDRLKAAIDKSTTLNQIRQEDRRWRQDWKIAFSHWDAAAGGNAFPDRLDKLPTEARDFVREELLPRLHEDERQRLQAAEGRWPQYPRALVELVDHDRVAFRLLMPMRGPSRWDDLPADFHKKMKQVKAPELTKKRLTRVEGHWPEFALLVTDVARRNNITMPKQLGPCVPRDFPRPVQEFINQKLMNFNTRVIDKDERERLKATEGYWPTYPKMVLELARKYKLSVPGASLPTPAGSPGYWDAYREANRGDDRAVVSDLVLRVFTQFELSDAERADIGVNLSDPITRERLQEEYKKRHEDEWKRLVEADKAKRAKKIAK